ncbi:hypothetical protein TRIUR3_27651 [Triticum urartu]|uniref:Uncharacterized protein n=1 Tax=Triticum urartu TaxID=4572 RepID=M7Z978_TRIUA|nr:hypothetical protein TRIUR3_27651 [Triticum urartu]
MTERIWKPPVGEQESTRVEGGGRTEITGALAASPPGLHASVCEEGGLQSRFDPAARPSSRALSAVQRSPRLVPLPPTPARFATEAHPGDGAAAARRRSAEEAGGAAERGKAVARRSGGRLRRGGTGEGGAAPEREKAAGEVAGLEERGCHGEREDWGKAVSRR